MYVRAEGQSKVSVIGQRRVLPYIAAYMHLSRRDSFRDGYTVYHTLYMTCVSCIFTFQPGTGHGYADRILQRGVMVYSSIY